MNATNLRHVMLDRNVSLKELSKRSGITSATLYRKLNGQSDIYLTEIKAITDALNLTSEEMDSIFFTEGVSIKRNNSEVI